MVEIIEAFRKTPERVAYHLYPRGCVGDKDKIKFSRISIEELQDPVSNLFNSSHGTLRRCRSRMRVSEKIGGHLGSESVHQGLGIQCRSSMVEIDAVYYR
ncbi:hypothetical protein RRF57_011199 [Xylaria bambusicola]|uniref:Uncharacterized protein n=1 Tax=Xylaria bambusicola TaxID=326684 RepID=A0AAN7UTG6_9PEZI